MPDVSLQDIHSPAYCPPHECKDLRNFTTHTPPQRHDEIMPKLSVNELSTYRWSFEEDVFAYAKHGFDSIGIWRAKLAEYGTEKGAELIQENGLRVSSVGWAGGFTGGDGRSFNDSIHDALDAVDLAAQLGAECLIVVSGDRNNHTGSHSRRLLRQALTEVCEAAAALHLDVALEPMHLGAGTQGCFLNNIQNTIDAIGEISWPGLGLVFDSYHLGHDPNLFQWLPDVAPLVRLVQLGDAAHVPMGEQDRLLLGQGKQDLAAIVECFEDAGYDGSFELELIGESIEHLDYDQMLEHSFQALNALVRTPAES